MPADAFLEVDGLSKSFRRVRWWHRDRDPVEAVRDVSFRLDQGGVLGLVGPSGSGKSTVARCLAMFEEPDRGSIRLNGRDLRGSNAAERRALRADVQLIFQDAAASLNPGFTAEEVLVEPLRIQRRGTAASRREEAVRWLEKVGLRAASLDRRPLSFSGGERRRLAIARALMLGPSLLILDEAFSGVDVKLQVQLSDLLVDLQRQLTLTCILISHDLTLVGQLASHIAVMEEGAIVEQGPAPELLAAPRHPRTRELLDAGRALRLPGAL